MSTSVCRHCGSPIKWRETAGWLVSTSEHPEGVWGTAVCPMRPEADGGPSAGHALRAVADGHTAELANLHCIESFEIDWVAPEFSRVVGLCRCHNPDGNGVGRMDFHGATVADVLEQWTEHFLKEVEHGR